MDSSDAGRFVATGCSSRVCVQYVAMSSAASLHEPWASVRQRLRDRGLRWTPQRRAVIGVLAATNGHLTGAELVERCRAVDPATIPSTVYRTLDVLEELGVIRHGHGADGREEFHVLPEVEHGHLYCQSCGGRWEVSVDEMAPTVRAIEAGHGFAVDLSHVTIVGQCASCSDASTHVR